MLQADKKKNTRRNGLIEQRKNKISACRSPSDVYGDLGYCLHFAETGEIPPYTMRCWTYIAKNFVDNLHTVTQALSTCGRYMIAEKKVAAGTANSFAICKYRKKSRRRRTQLCILTDI
jgi:hypothetical protein